LCLTAENGSVLQYSELQQEEHQGQEYGHYKDFQPQERHSTKQQQQQQHQQQNNANYVTVLTTMINHNYVLAVIMTSLL